MNRKKSIVFSAEQKIKIALEPLKEEQTILGLQLSIRLLQSLYKTNKNSF